MKTKVEPTVDKWEGDQEANKCEFCGVVKPVQRYYLQVKNKHFDDNKSGCYSTFIYYCQDCGIEDTHSVQEAKAEMVAEIENSKIISSIGYRPSKFRGLSAVAIYNMALDDLLASLKQEEEK